MSLTSDDVRNVQFTTVRLREGYDMREVDEFLDRIIATFEERERGSAPSASALTGDTVREQHFRTVRLAEGYDLEEVDTFLDQVSATLDERRPIGAGHSAPATSATASTPSTSGLLPEALVARLSTAIPACPVTAPIQVIAPDGRTFGITDVVVQGDGIRLVVG